MHNVSCEEGKERWERVSMQITMPISRVQFTGWSKIKRNHSWQLLFYYVYGFDFNPNPT